VESVTSISHVFQTVSVPLRGLSQWKARADYRDSHNVSVPLRGLSQWKVQKPAVANIP
jgi:hypothetical protein